MTDEATPATDNPPAGISEDELKGIFRTQVKEELDERGMTKEIVEKLNVLGSLDELFEKHKGDPDSLLGKIGEMIDGKLKGVSSGGTGSGTNGGGSTAEGRRPKIRIFS